jgi:hypothetical protein
MAPSNFEHYSGEAGVVLYYICGAFVEVWAQRRCSFDKPGTLYAGCYFRVQASELSCEYYRIRSIVIGQSSATKIFCPTARLQKKFDRRGLGGRSLYWGQLLFGNGGAERRDVDQLPKVDGSVDV